jgi:hypothetical protein
MQRPHNGSHWKQHPVQVWRERMCSSCSARSGLLLLLLLLLLLVSHPNATRWRSGRSAAQDTLKQLQLMVQRPALTTAQQSRVWVRESLVPRGRHCGKRPSVQCWRVAASQWHKDSGWRRIHEPQAGMQFENLNDKLSWKERRDAMRLTCPRLSQNHCRPRPFQRACTQQQMRPGWKAAPAMLRLSSGHALDAAATRANFAAAPRRQHTMLP